MKWNNTKPNGSILNSGRKKKYMEVTFRLLRRRQLWSISVTNRPPIDSFVFCIMCRESVSPLTLPTMLRLMLKRLSLGRKVFISGGEGPGVTFTAADHPAAWVVETHPWLYTPNFAMMTDVEKSGHNSLLDTSDVHLRWKSPQWFPAADLRGFHLSGVSYAKHESHNCNQNALKAPCLWH